MARFDSAITILGSTIDSVFTVVTYYYASRPREHDWDIEKEIRPSTHPSPAYAQKRDVRFYIEKYSFEENNWTHAAEFLWLFVLSRKP